VADLRASAPAPIAYSIPEAANAIGYSEAQLKKFIAAGDITPRYATTKPTILHSDLLAWAESLPVDKPGAAS
jgi:hypothetical protein